jgi:hypothetical protein
LETKKNRYRGEGEMLSMDAQPIPLDRYKAIAE